MRVVTLEEHYLLPNLVKRIDPEAIVKRGFPLDFHDRLEKPLLDVGAGRLADMDEAGITVQVLSASGPGADLLDGAEGVGLARDMNDVIGQAVAAHPDRLAAFAHLPMRSPQAAADELERAVRDLGFRGALINGLTQDRFLDDPRFDPILARAEQLERAALYSPWHSAGGGAQSLLRWAAWYGRLPSLDCRLGLAFGNGYSRAATRAFRRARSASETQIDYRAHGRRPCGHAGARRHGARPRRGATEAFGRPDHP